MSKVSYATFVDVGLVGPKARPEGVVDGYAVNILQLWQNRLSKGVTEWEHFQVEMIRPPRS